MPDTMIRLDQGRGDYAHVRASEISSLHWERGTSYAKLIVTMQNGSAFTVTDYQGSAYAVEREILAAINGPTEKDYYRGD